MPRRRQFDETTVLDAAFKLLAEKGWAAVSARELAERLGSSTMPLYSAIGSMEALEARLKPRVFALLTEYQARPYTENPFMNMALGQVLFARDHKWLYRFLHLDSPAPLDAKSQRELRRAVEKKLGHPLPYARAFGRIKPQAFDNISLMAWVFTHGLCMAVMAGMLGPQTESSLCALLERAGAAFIAHENPVPPT